MALRAWALEPLQHLQNMAHKSNPSSWLMFQQLAATMETVTQNCNLAWVSGVENLGPKMAMRVKNLEENMA